jgi:hypothetical protein
MTAVASSQIGHSAALTRCVNGGPDLRLHHILLPLVFDLRVYIHIVSLEESFILLLARNVIVRQLSLRFQNMFMFKIYFEQSVIALQMFGRLPRHVQQSILMMGDILMLVLCH